MYVCVCFKIFKSFVMRVYFYAISFLILICMVWCKWILFSRSYQDTIIWLMCYYYHSSLLCGHLWSLQYLTLLTPRLKCLWWWWRRWWHADASRQWDVHQLRRQSLQCSWTSRLQQSADGPQTVWLVIQPFQTVAEEDFIWSVGPMRSVRHPFTLTALPKSTYLLIC